MNTNSLTEIFSKPASLVSAVATTIVAFFVVKIIQKVSSRNARRQNVTTNATTSSASFSDAFSPPPADSPLMMDHAAMTERARRNWEALIDADMERRRRIARRHHDVLRRQLQTECKKRRVIRALREGLDENSETKLEDLSSRPRA